MIRIEKYFARVALAIVFMGGSVIAAFAIGFAVDVAASIVAEPAKAACYAKRMYAYRYTMRSTVVCLSAGGK